jgi:hypothetical protein
VAEDQPRSQEPRAAAEGVEDGGHVRPATEDRGHVVVGLARVDDRGLPGLARDVELGLERGQLCLPGGVVVVVIEPHLAGRDHAGVAQSLTQPLGHLGAPALRVVRVDAGGGGKARLPGSQGEGAVGGLRGFTDDDDVGDAGRPGALEDLRAVRVVGGVAQVAMGVDEHGVYHRCHPERSSG